MAMKVVASVVAKVWVRMGAGLVVHMAARCSAENAGYVKEVVGAQGVGELVELVGSCW